MSRSAFITKPSISFVDECLSISKTKLRGVFNCLTGKSGDFWISIIPSLNVSGYGESAEESEHDLQYNLDVFCKDIFQLDITVSEKKLKKPGWEKSVFFKKKYSSTFVDKDGILQNFDSPEDVKKSILQTA